MSDIKAYPFDTRVPLIHELLGDEAENCSWDNGVGGQVHVVADPKDVLDVFHRPDFERSDLMKQVGGKGLIFSDGSLWLEQRRLAQPHFHERVMDRYLESIYECIDGVSNRIDASIQAGESFFLAEEMIRFTIRTTYKAFFGINLDEDHDLGALLCQYFDAIGHITLAILRRGKSIPSQALEEFRVVQKEVRNETERILRYRADGDVSGTDLLGSFEPNIDVELLKDEIQTFFLAGAETTSNLMSWLVLLLEAADDEYAKVIEEIDSVVVSGERVPAESTKDMPRLYAAMYETMRLYPPVWLPSRQVKGDTTINGRAVQEKDWFLVCVYFLHRNNRIWDDPHVFRPDRFLDDSPKDRYAYAPFGGGRHLCIGKHFAELETMLLTSTLLKRYRFERVTDAPLDPWPGLTLKPMTDIPIRAHLR